MSQKEPVNPFYAAVVLIGVAFVVTTLAYVVMLVQLGKPDGAERVAASPMMQFLERRGEWLMLTEAGVLAIAAFLAMGIDRLRSWRAAKDRRSGQH